MHEKWCSARGSLRLARSRRMAEGVNVGCPSSQLARVLSSCTGVQRHKMEIVRKLSPGYESVDMQRATLDKRLDIDIVGKRGNGGIAAQVPDLGKT